MCPGVTRKITGVEGLDEVLCGGLLAERAYLLRGQPGTGKTILGLHFLTAGDSGLLVALEESEADVRANASRLGFDLDAANVEVLDLSPDSTYFTEDQGYDLFEPDEVEGGSIRSSITDAVDRVDPERVFVDPVSLLRQLSPDDYQFRKEAASMIRYFTDRGGTVLFSTQPSTDEDDADLQFLADGALELDRSAKGRTISVEKFRGSDFASGRHTLRITDEGLVVYPRLVPGDHAREFTAETVSSGVPEVDALLGGGIERGTVTVIAGPSGVGKSTTASAFAKEAAARGERSVLYLFEEDPATLYHRSESIGIPVREMEDEGTLAVERIEPVTISPDEFAAMVRTEVEQRGAELVVLDGIAGYRLSIRGDEDELLRELHSLARYCRNMGVTMILVEETDSVTGEFRPTDKDISYLADSILFLRYLELDGEIRKAMGVLKKRAGDFERTLREFRITGDGIVLGEPLTGLRGILSGTPEWTDPDDNDDR